MEKQRQADILRINDSKVYCFYKPLINKLISPAKYLTLNLPFNKMQLQAQARLNIGDFYFEKQKHYLSINSICSICNLQKNESLEHFLTESCLYRGLRLEWVDSLFGEDIPSIWVN